MSAEEKDKQFISRIVSKKAGDIPTFASGITSHIIQSYIDVLEDYLTISRTRIDNNYALTKLQIHLTEDILVNENLILSCNKEIGKRESRKESAAHDDLDKMC